MGTVREKIIKRTAYKLVKQYPDLWTEDFEHNKRILSQIAEIKSKVYRNRIAGYITRLKVREREGTLV
ncbi:MAG TPA: 30S ribosomal protein S17e [Candidatus Korarchaeota archaeon]|nr:30S ribosomal protein S17e [Candidatus Korarchaeota archaeon]HDI74301.1 30S ribosomal protein S17e [Candidatus Korarchaeota archaeon]